MLSLEPRSVPVTLQEVAHKWSEKSTRWYSDTMLRYVRSITGVNHLKLHNDRIKKLYNDPATGFALLTRFILRVLCRRILTASPAVWLPLLSLPPRVSIGRRQVISQMPLELVVISNAFHAPDDQLLTKNVIHQKLGDGGRAYLCPGIEVLHDLGWCDPTFETLVFLDLIDFGLARFSV